MVRQEEGALEVRRGMLGEPGATFREKGAHLSPWGYKPHSAMSDHWSQSSQATTCDIWTMPPSMVGAQVWSWGLTLCTSVFPSGAQLLSVSLRHSGLNPLSSGGSPL